MRRLIISNTHYQTIVALQLRLTLFKEDEVVLLISDHSKGSEQVVERLNEKHLFEKVDYIRTRDVLKKSGKLYEWKDAFSFSFFAGNRYSFYLKNIENRYFDEIVVFNYVDHVHGLFAILSAINSNIRISLMEESVLSYNNAESPSKKLHLSGEVRKWIGKKSVYDAVGNFYCFYPSLYTGTFTPVSIPLLHPDSEIVAILKDVFGVREQDLHYDRKYIFFASVYDFEGGQPIGEFELVKKVADTVGKDNLLVKIHPRDQRTVYHDNGFTVDQNSSVPWEIIQLSHDFSHHVFLTATSSSVLSGNFMTDIPVRTYFLFELCHTKGNAAEKSVQQIYDLLRNDNVKEIFQSVQIAKGLGEIL